MRDWCVAILLIMISVALSIIVFYILKHFSINLPTYVNLAICFFIASISMFLAEGAIRKELK